VTVKTERHPSTIHYNNYSRDKMKACITDSKSLDDKNGFLELIEATSDHSINLFIKC